jgi:hypothetical protein
LINRIKKINILIPTNFNKTNIFYNMRVYVKFFCFASLLSLTAGLLNLPRLLAEDSKVEYSGDATYVIGNIVTVGGDHFYCTNATECNANAPTVDNAVGWTLMVMTGALDLSNDNFDAATAYANGAIVVYHMYNWTCALADGCKGINPVDASNPNAWIKGALFTPNAGSDGDVGGETGGNIVDE